MTLAPNNLRRLQQELSDAVIASFPENTRRAYRSAMRKFARWTEENDAPSLPADPETVAAYLYHLHREGKSKSAAATARSAIAKAHELAGIPEADNPAKSAHAAQAMRLISRQSPPPKQSAALLPQDIELIIQTAPIPRKWKNGGAIHQEGRRQAENRARLDIALCLTLRDAGLRRSEAAELLWSDVSAWPDGTGRISVRRSKTNRTGPPETVAVTGQTMKALWAIRPETPGPDEKVFKLSDHQIARRVAQAAKHAGLGEGYTGHSGRIGLARTMTQNGAPVNATMKQGRWKSAQTVALYTRGEEAGTALRWLR